MGYHKNIKLKHLSWFVDYVISRKLQLLQIDIFKFKHEIDSVY